MKPLHCGKSTHLVKLPLYLCLCVRGGAASPLAASDDERASFTGCVFFFFYFMSASASKLGPRSLPHCTCVCPLTEIMRKKLQRIES